MEIMLESEIYIVKVLTAVFVSGFFANWGNIGMYIGFLPFMFLLQRSLRYSVLISGLLVAIGASIKCIGKDDI